MIDKDTRKKANEIRDRISRDAANAASFAYNNLTPGKKGAIVGLFSDGLSADERYIVWGWIFQKSGEPLRRLHSKDLDIPQWIALSDWSSVAEVGGVWLTQGMFYIELAQVKAAALEAFDLSEGRLESVPEEPISEPTMVETAIALGGVVSEVEPESITDASGYTSDDCGPVCSEDDDDDPLWFLTPPSPLVLPDVIEYIDPAPAPGRFLETPEELVNILDGALDNAPAPAPVTIRLKYKTRSSGTF